jgi:hypothetical protein
VTLASGLVPLTLDPTAVHIHSPQPAIRFAAH